MKMKRRLFSIIMLILVVTTILLTGCQSGNGNNIASESRKGVVRVWTTFENCRTYVYDPKTGASAIFLENFSSSGLGSAFGIGNPGEETRYFITNRHVVKLSEFQEPSEYAANRPDLVEKYPDEFLALAEIYQSNPKILLYTEGTPSTCYIFKDDYAVSDAVGVDLSRCMPCDILYTAKEDEPDLAVLRAAEEIDGRIALPLLSESDHVDSGDTVYALGYPASTDAVNTTYAASVDRVTVTDGIVSLHSELYDNGVPIEVIQHTANINHGNSGGPLINENGAVVGVNTWGTNIDGITSSYSIEIHYVRDILDDLHIDISAPKPGINWIPIAIAAGVAAVVVILVIVLVVINKGKKNSGVSQPAQMQQAAPAAGQTPEAGHAPIAGDSGLRIQGVSGYFAGRRFAVSGQVRIGRNPNGNDLVYPENTPGISGSHCMLFIRDGQLYLQDVGSSNGTFLSGGRRLAPNQAVILHVGDRFYLATERESFVIAQKGGV